MLRRFQEEVRVHRSRFPGRRSDYILYGAAQCLWVYSVEVASRQPSEAYNFEVAQNPRAPYVQHATQNVAHKTGLK
jgi:hypothetical protein